MFLIGKHVFDGVISMTVTQLPSGTETLRVEVSFPSITPQELFNYWTQPALLQRWWPQEAEIQAYVGGAYHLSWPKRDWHLRGYYTFFEPGVYLAFTWKWDQNIEDAKERVVTIALTPWGGGGTQLHLTHGPYDATPEDQAVRIEQHFAGWQHFLSLLQQVHGAYE